MEKAYDGDKLGHVWSRPLCVYNEAVGTRIDSYSGKRLVGTPTHHEPRFWDGSLLRDHYSEDDWPLLAFSFKSNLMNSYAIGLERLRMIKPYNPVFLHRNDAEKFGVRHGDTISIESPGGKVLALALAAGVNLNDLGFSDPTRKDGTATWLENVSGASVRQGLPVRVSVMENTA